MLLLYYSIYLFLGSVCLVRGAPVDYTPGQQRQDASSLSTSSSPSFLNPTFRKHGTFQKIHITNINTNPDPHPNLNLNHKPSSSFSPSFLTNPNPNPPATQPPSTPSRWSRKIYGLFLNARTIKELSTTTTTHKHSIIRPAWLPNNQNQNQKEIHPTPSNSNSLSPSPLPQHRIGIYTLMRHLRRPDRVWAPAAILFAMVWVGVMAMGVVECIGGCWRKGMNRRERRAGAHERVLFDGGCLEEVVIEAVPVDDFDEDDEDYEGGGDGEDGRKMLKKM